MQRQRNTKSRDEQAHSNARIALVVSRYNEDVTSRLLEGARESLTEHGIPPGSHHVVWCPGAFELPQAAQVLAHTGRWDGIVCLGAVIRGETPHFEYVAAAAAHGIQAASLKFGIPMGFGLLTTNTLEQAMERAGGKHGNKGREATEAVLTMVAMARQQTKLKRHTPNIRRKMR